MGRHAKPFNLHMLHGTLREDRHGDVESHFNPAGAPVKPADMGEDASRLWDSVIADLNTGSVATRIDSATLAEMCAWYQRYKTFANELDALGYEPKASAELMYLCSTSWKNFEAMAIQFGLTPVARMKLKIQKDEKPKSIMTRSRETA